MLFFRKKEIEVDFTNIHLMRPCMTLHKNFRDAISEHRRHKTEDFYYHKIRTRKQFMAYLQELRNLESGRNLREGVVPSTAFWLTDGTHYLGSGDVRHHLNEGLMTFGGHIGYSIRPALQNKGMGTLLLSLLLKEAKQLNIKTVRITCFDENAASSRVIEKNGGILIDTAYNLIRGVYRKTRIYEI